MTKETIEDWRDRAIMAYRRANELRPNIMTTSLLDVNLKAIEKLYADGDMSTLRYFAIGKEEYLMRRITKLPKAQ